MKDIQAAPLEEEQFDAFGFLCPRLNETEILSLFPDEDRRVMLNMVFIQNQAQAGFSFTPKNRIAMIDELSQLSGRLTIRRDALLERLGREIGITRASYAQEVADDIRQRFNREFLSLYNRLASLHDLIGNISGVVRQLAVPSDGTGTMVSTAQASMPSPIPWTSGVSPQVVQQPAVAPPLAAALVPPLPTLRPLPLTPLLRVAVDVGVAQLESPQAAGLRVSILAHDTLQVLRDLLQHPSMAQYATTNLNQAQQTYLTTEIHHLFIQRFLQPLCDILNYYTGRLYTVELNQQSDRVLQNMIQQFNQDPAFREVGVFLQYMLPSLQLLLKNVQDRNGVRLGNQVQLKLDYVENYLKDKVKGTPGLQSELVQLLGRLGFGQL